MIKIHFSRCEVEKRETLKRETLKRENSAFLRRELPFSKLLIVILIIFSLQLQIKFFNIISDFCFPLFWHRQIKILYLEILTIKSYRIYTEYMIGRSTIIGRKVFLSKVFRFM